MEEGLRFEDSGNEEKFSLILTFFKFNSNIFTDFSGSRAAVYLGKKMAFDPTNLFQPHTSFPESVPSIWLSKTAMCYLHAPLSPSPALSGNLFYTIWYNSFPKGPHRHGFSYQGRPPIPLSKGTWLGSQCPWLFSSETELIRGFPFKWKSINYIYMQIISYLLGLV